MERGRGRWWWGGCCSVRPTFYVVCMASLWVLVTAQARAAPPTTSPCYLYARDLPTTVWGFIVTLIALTVDGWGTRKNLHDRIWLKVLVVIVGDILHPFNTLSERMESLVYKMKLMRRLSGTPLAEPYIKILSGCHVFVNMSPDACEKLRQLDTFESNIYLYFKDFSDALVIGKAVEGKNRLQLSVAGKEALIKAGLLPPVEQLKILRGYSGFAVAASAAQGVGYVYGVVVRLVQGLHVSPLEAIAFMLNVVVVMKALLHFFSSGCHTLLVLYLEENEETIFTSQCEKPGAEWRLSSSEMMKSSILMGVGIAILPGGLLLFLIIYIANATSLTVAIPLIVIGVSTLLFVCGLQILSFERLGDYNTGPQILGGIVDLIIALLNLTGYIYSLVVSVKYWESMGFNIRSSSYWSQLIPYIG